jgi:hypothetical protein
MQRLSKETSSRREYLTKLFAHITQQVPAYAGVTVQPTANGDLFIQLKKSTNCLKRFKTLSISSNYLLQESQVVPLNQIPADESKDYLHESTTDCATKKIIVRKEGEKDVWIEVWSNQLNGGLLQSCKVSGECSKIYADAVFGSITWSRDLTKVSFVGEVPAVASYKNPWDLPEKKDDEKEEKKEPEHFQEDKFLYDEEFGELLVGKKTAALFVYDLSANKI